MKQLTRLLLDDMRPALGVTEPGAIAFAVATAREHVRGRLRSIRVRLNSGMYKNALTCGIPHCDEVGHRYAAALGYLAGDASLGLEALARVNATHRREARTMIEKDLVHVELDSYSSRIYILAHITTDEGDASVIIRDAHTNVVEITENGRIVFSRPNAIKAPSAPSTPTVHRYTLRQILNYALTVPLDEIAFLEQAYDINLALFHQSLKSRKTGFTRHLFQQNGRRIISEDEQATASLLCNAAIEARVLGFSRPAMSITGSGAHGIIATLPLYASQQVCGYSREELLRATALCFLVCHYIKEYSGKLSAFCGCAIAAGSGMACGLTFLKGGRYKALTLTLRNMASGLPGMVCDGGNHGCTMKGVVAVDAAFRATRLALDNISVSPLHGINGFTPEETMRHIGLIASPGMEETERTILNIMQRKQTNASRIKNEK